MSLNCNIIVSDVIMMHKRQLMPTRNLFQPTQRIVLL